MSEIVIVASSSDPASMNIASRLLELADWDREGDLRFYKSYCMLNIQEELIEIRDLEGLLESIGISPRLIVFASRHKSREALPWLGGHFTGILQKDSFEFSAPAPYALKSLLISLQRNLPDGFQLSAEATHHGPLDLHTPSLFAEIGSAESQWLDPAAGMAVAKSILDLEGDLEHAGEPVLLGIGGGHYVQRQTELMLSRPVAFGHMFSKYQASMLDAASLERAASLSNASCIYIDRKSFSSLERKRLEELADALGLRMMSKKDIVDL